MTAAAAHRAMRPWAFRWGAGVVLSGVAHVGVAALVVLLLHPGPVADQPRPQSELRIETEAVTQSAAVPKAVKGDKLASAAPDATAAVQGQVPETTAQPVTLPSVQAPAVKPLGQVAKPADAPPVTAPTAPPVSVTAAMAPPQDITPAAAPPQQTAASIAPPSTAVTATLAWAGDSGAMDPVSLKAIAAFMRPGDVSAASDDVHDGLQAVLSSVPCSRLQAEFNPETGSLELRGHVPDDALKAPVLAALQAQLGSGIKVDDAIQILPRPQCGALSGIADVGLPQSQDQLTNPRLIGADAQARTFDYAKGQVMVLDLAAPDYDAFVYVDFFDAAGNVIHLVPNDTVPIRKRPAKSALHVGAADADEPFLHITIGPPYGQEIAVAFAASSPLYDGLRPLSEPAAPYLEWLKTRVALAREKDKDFKGEWVYFMVKTHD